MKKFTFMLAVLASALFITSCSSSDDDLTNEEGKLVTKTFTVESSATRAIVRENTFDTQGPYVDWQETDELSMWADNNAQHKFKFQKYGNYHNYATFTGDIESSATKYYALYPYQADATISGGIITATIPSEQTATSKSFDPKAAICTASAGGTASSVTFDHACAYLKITTTAECENITVTSTDNTWKMAGKVTINAASAGAEIKSFVDGATSVTLKAASGNIAPGSYLIAIASSTRFPGLTVSVKYSDTNTVTNTVEGSKLTALASGAIYNLGTAPTK